MSRFYLPRPFEIDANGEPLGGAQLFFYEHGTVTPANTYSDAGLTTANSNPVEADADGRFGDIFLTPGQNYDVVLKNASDVTIWSADDVASAQDYDADLAALAGLDTSSSNAGKFPQVDTDGGWVLGTPASGVNVAINGSMEIWQRGTSGSSAAGSRTFYADRRYTNPTGGAVTVAQSTEVPTGSSVRYSKQVTGATDVTTVIVDGERVEAANIPAIKRETVFRWRVYNDTGANFTPSLLLGTPAAADDFTTVTNRLTQTLQECPVGEWTEVYHSDDISTYTDVDNGLQVELQIPSGSLDSASKVVRITEASYEPGAVPSTFRPRMVGHELALCQRYFQTYSTVSVAGYQSGTSAVFLPVTNVAPMREAPTATVTANPTLSNATGFGVNSESQTQMHRIGVTVSSLGVFTISSNGTYTLSAEL